ncbi:hypothetical protein ACIQTX_13775 [Microbacterium sp. NPDC090281]|uniref:hypothetical protein n=1 Tax=Microbacterium sp. NPDC090281 TaxID=3364208 RepID=UPI003807FA00
MITNSETFEWQILEYAARWTQPDATSDHLVPNSVPDIRMAYSVSAANSRM